MSFFQCGVSHPETIYPCVLHKGHTCSHEEARGNRWPSDTERAHIEDLAVARTVEPIRAGERVVAKTPDPMELHMGCRLGGGHDFYGDSDICSKCGLHGKIIRMLTYKTNNSRASELADECGKLRQENLELLAENARLRRQLERVKR